MQTPQLESACRGEYGTHRTRSCLGGIPCAHMQCLEHCSQPSSHVRDMLLLRRATVCGRVRRTYRMAVGPPATELLKMMTPSPLVLSSGWHSCVVELGRARCTHSCV